MRKSIDPQERMHIGIKAQWDRENTIEMELIIFFWSAKVRTSVQHFPGLTSPLEKISFTGLVSPGKCRTEVLTLALQKNIINSISIALHGCYTAHTVCSRENTSSFGSNIEHQNYDVTIE